MGAGDKCERCDNERVPRERFCKSCKKVVLDELYQSGQVLPAPWNRARGDEHKENTRETKHGREG